MKFSEYFEHIKNCEYKETLYECQIEKYNYVKKTFEKCHFKDNYDEVDNHFKSCAFTKYRCIFCDEKIIQVNLKNI